MPLGFSNSQYTVWKSWNGLDITPVPAVFYNYVEDDYYVDEQTWTDFMNGEYD